MKQTVFVLGAGFSNPANMPIQSEIMGLIVQRYSKPIQETVRSTVRRLFGILDADQMEGVPLEDVFTMLDRARLSGETFAGVSRVDITQAYDHLLSAIIREFDRAVDEFDTAQKCYVSFFKELIRVRVGDGLTDAHEDDPFCVLTLNWDTIPDYLIEELGRSSKAGVDYAFYDYDLTERDGFIPSIRRKGEGLFNVKLLKLHGSVNWLACTCCGRLFSDNSDSSRPQVIDASKFHCRFCNNVQLENLIITPTLVKDISNSHLKNVWHNALLDLQAAERIVFVGYSLPMADFEFRYILLKALVGDPSKEIRVVLYPPDAQCSPQSRWERDAIQLRYEKFFGDRNLKFKYMDSADFMTNPTEIWDW